MRLSDHYRFTYPCLLLFTLIGAGLRFYGLERESFGLDELASTMASGVPSLKEFWNYNIGGNAHPPFYFLVLHFVMRTLGDNEFWVRFPSALLGTLSIPAIFQLGKRVFGELEGLLAAGLVATLWSPQYYSQEARPYSFMIFFCITASYYLIAWCERLIAGTEGKRDKWCFLVSAIFLMYSHLFGFAYVLFLILMALLLIRFRKLNSNDFNHGLLVLLVASPRLVIFIVRLLHQPKLLYDNPPIGFGAAYSLVKFFFLQNTIWSNAVVLIVLTFLIYRVAFYLFILKGVFNPRKLRRESVFAVIVVLLVTLPFAFTFVASKYIDSLYLERSLLVSLPMAYILFSRAILDFINIRWIQRAIVVSLPLWLLGSLVGEQRYFQTVTKPEFRTAARHVDQTSASTKRKQIVAYYFWSWEREKYFDYYFKRVGSELRPTLTVGDKYNRSEYSKLLLHAKTGDELWLLLYRSAAHPKDESETLLREALKSHRQIGQVAFNEIRVVQLEKKGTIERDISRLRHELQGKEGR